MNDAMHEFAPFQCGISPMGAVSVALPCPIPLGFNPAARPRVHESDDAMRVRPVRVRVSRPRIHDPSDAFIWVPVSDDRAILIARI
jgi:hypothetical protein